MPHRSRIVYDLPAELRRELDVRIVRGGFSRYREHAEWLAERGHSASESALQRYGATLRHLERIRVVTREAEALARADHDQGELAMGSVRLAQTALYDLLFAAQEPTLKDVSAASRAVADLARASRAMRDERRLTAAAAAEQAVDATRRVGGLTAEVEAALRAAFERE